MLDSEPNSDDRRLWQALAAAEDRASAQPPPDELTLAAYMEGRLGEAEARAVEAALASSPEGRLLPGEMMRLLQEPPMLAPAAVLTAAASMVAGAPHWRRRWMRGLAWAAVMMFSAGACWAGLHVGQMAGGRIVAERQAISELNDWSGMSAGESADVVFFLKGDQ